MSDWIRDVYVSKFNMVAERGYKAVSKGEYTLEPNKGFGIQILDIWSAKWLRPRNCLLAWFLS